ncbi:MAG: aminoacyl--tRNA ligase-related protein [Candidatus Aenigmatarchaeota archaeon]
MEFTINSADSGKIGGSVSEEFVARFDNSTIEIAHIFYLGIRYSKSGDLYIQLSTGERVPVHMGCYGIGLTRLIPVVAYQNITSSGLIWPALITPFNVEIIQAI